MDFMVWNKERYQNILDYFNSKRDLKYLDFNKKIVNSNYPMIGVRTGDVKQLAKKVSKTDINSFLECKGNKYYEEILLEGFVICNIKDLELALYHLHNYLDKIDSWALCDSFASAFKIVSKNKDLVFEEIKKYVESDKEFTVRMGIVLLLNYYIEDKYIDNIFSIIDGIDREEYYIKMAISWLLSMCYIKYKDKTLHYLDNCKVSDFIYNKTISKICDSYQVDKSDKEVLKKMRR